MVIRPLGLYLLRLVCAKADPATALERALERPSRRMALAFLAMLLLVCFRFGMRMTSLLTRLRRASFPAGATGSDHPDSSSLSITPGAGALRGGPAITSHYQDATHGENVAGATRSRSGS